MVPLSTFSCGYNVMFLRRASRTAVVVSEPYLRAVGCRFMQMNAYLLVMNSKRCILNELENLNLKLETCLHGVRLEEASLWPKPSVLIFLEKLQTKSERKLQGLLRQTKAVSTDEIF